jgi:hypothetical protein
MIPIPGRCSGGAQNRGGGGRSVFLVMRDHIEEAGLDFSRTLMLLSAMAGH